MLNHLSRMQQPPNNQRTLIMTLAWISSNSSYFILRIKTKNVSFCSLKIIIRSFTKTLFNIFDISKKHCGNLRDDESSLARDDKMFSNATGFARDTKDKLNICEAILTWSKITNKTSFQIHISQNCNQNPLSYFSFQIPTPQPTPNLHPYSIAKLQSTSSIFII